ncbi:hypothetical protein MKZ38_005247 [Zalerion maritima]|uniref:Major facilitator superfamily (MFS) profile domain-containing protein n=1 Tax=Zalerion maritima TaxID=339359 RepID=A0AAD5WPD7_9PEZI|nr:hypothetical protein MKZ38_005247 [Zalerion maritima]
MSFLGWKLAFSLTKEEVRDARPPGTVELLAHQPAKLGDAEEISDEVIHFPIPTADPSDPLNWPTWRKATVLAVAGLFAFVTNFTSSGIAPGLQAWPIAYPEDPARPFSELTHLIAVNVLMCGAANIWWVPLSNMYGRRPVLLVTTLLLTVCTAWCGVAKTYDSLLAARIFQGIGGAASDTVAPAMVGDVYFMHQRGRAMAMYTVSLVGGALLGGVCGGYITFNLGWAYNFWVGVGLSAPLFPAVLFLVPETLYIRHDDVPASDSQRPGSKEDAPGIETVEQIPAPAQKHKPFTWARSLGFRKSHPGLYHHFIQPWRSLMFPGTWVVMCHYAGLVGGTVTISTVGPQIVAQPPYLWGNNSGLINVGALIGALLGAAYTYFVSDFWLTQKAHSKSHHGLAEPEDRLPIMFPALFVATAGFLVFGFCAQNPGPNVWVGIEAGYGMIAFGLMQAPSIGFSYVSIYRLPPMGFHALLTIVSQLIDAYSYMAGDCFVMVTILRSIIAFAWTFFVAAWVEKKGVAEPFGIFGMLMGMFSLLTVPLWLFGKRSRIATASKLVTE